MNTMYTYISPFTSCSEVLAAAKNVSYESEFIRCADTLEAWEMNCAELKDLVDAAIMSRTYAGPGLDDLERARGILGHAVNIKVPRIIEKRNL
jgi:hypothetical protein